MDKLVEEVEGVVGWVVGHVGHVTGGGGCGGGLSYPQGVFCFPPYGDMTDMTDNFILFGCFLVVFVGDMTDMTDTFVFGVVDKFGGVGVDLDLG